RLRSSGPLSSHAAALIGHRSHAWKTSGSGAEPRRIPSAFVITGPSDCVLTLIEAEERGLVGAGDAEAAEEDDAFAGGVVDHRGVAEAARVDGARVALPVGAVEG